MLWFPVLHKLLWASINIDSCGFLALGTVPHKTSVLWCFCSCLVEGGMLSGILPQNPLPWSAGPWFNHEGSSEGDVQESASILHQSLEVGLELAIVYWNNLILWTLLSLCSSLIYAMSWQNRRKVFDVCEFLAFDRCFLTDWMFVALFLLKISNICCICLSVLFCFCSHLVSGFMFS